MGLKNIFLTPGLSFTLIMFLGFTWLVSITTNGNLNWTTVCLPHCCVDMFPLCSIAEIALTVALLFSHVLRGLTWQLSAHQPNPYWSKQAESPVHFNHFTLFWVHRLKSIIYQPNLSTISGQIENLWLTATKALSFCTETQSASLWVWTVLLKQLFCIMGMSFIVILLPPLRS